MRLLIASALAANIVTCTAYSQTPDAAGAAPPRNMRALIVANLQRPDPDPTKPAAYSGAVPGETTIFPASRHVREVEISDAVRRTLTMLHGWAWQTCLRAMVDGQRTTVAVFVEQNHVVDVRTALIADRCDEGNYSALAVKRPQPRLALPGKKAQKSGKTKNPKP